MLAVLGNPSERRTFTRQTSQEGQEPANRPVRLEALVGQQTVIAHAYAKAAGGKNQNDAGDQRGPTEKEGCDHRQHVHEGDPNDDRPIRAQLFKGLLAPQVRCVGRAYIRLTRLLNTGMIISGALLNVPA